MLLTSKQEQRSRHEIRETACTPKEEKEENLNVSPSREERLNLAGPEPRPIS
jgi:hypothetical protein